MALRFSKACLLLALGLTAILFARFQRATAMDYDSEEDKKMLSKRAADYDPEEDKKLLVKRSASGPFNYDIEVAFEDATRFSTTKYFVSVGVSTKTFFRQDWNRFGVYNPRFKNIAKELSPCVGRVGDVESAFLVFQPESGEAVSQENKDAFYEVFKEDFDTGKVAGRYQHVNISYWEWKSLHDFFIEVGWELTFTLNSLIYNRALQPDFTNIEHILAFCEENKLPFFGFEFFNEPNSWGVKYDGYSRSAEECVADFALLKTYQESKASFKQVKRIGPTVTSPARHSSARTYLESFIDLGGLDNLDAVAIHHYSFDGSKASVSDFLDPDILDQVGEAVAITQEMLEKKGKGDMPIHITELADGFGGGAKPLSYTFVSTFLFTDSLSQAALHGADVVHKFNYFSGASYRMMDKKAIPKAIYWLALAHKRMIEGPVLKASLSGTEDRYFRTYAHCIREDYKPDGANEAGPGGMVLTFLNMHEESVTASLPWPDLDLYMYVFQGNTTKDSDEEMFSSPEIFLNGEQLLVSDDDEVPTLKPEVVQNTKTFTVPRLSLGYIAIPDLELKDCKERKPVA